MFIFLLIIIKKLALFIIIIKDINCKIKTKKLKLPLIKKQKNNDKKMFKLSTKLQYLK